MEGNLSILLCVLTLSSLSLWLPQVTAVGGNCLLPDADELEMLLTDAMQDLSPGEVEPTLLDFNFTCLTVAEMRGFYSFLTASILFNTAEFPDPVRVFFDVGCRNLNPDVWDVRVNQARNSIRGNGSDAALRTDCGSCANPDIIPEILALEFDEETHCYVCDDACLESELRLCTGLNENLCCNVYDNGICEVDCPLNKEPDQNFDCQCINNFSGTDCRTCELTCQNGGMETANCTICICPDGFTGDECESDVDECESSPCVNGLCSNTIGSFLCVCSPGFTGDLCEIEINACDSDPCMNGASCVSEQGQFSCTCAVDFTGLTCQTRIDDCESNPCLNGATCLDGIADFTCSCPVNFDGRFCDTCNLTNCNNCSLTESGVCLGCIPGYRLSQDDTCVSECDTIPSTCLGSSTCVNVPGGIVCICPEGVTGEFCEADIDECLSFPCVNGECINGNASFSCECPANFNGDLCENCLLDGCLNCSATEENVCLECQVGFLTDGAGACVSECIISSPCQNDGICENTENGIVCTCQPGFSGDRCQEDINFCESNPCLNGGTCIDETNEFLCQCPGNFSGVTCEMCNFIILDGECVTPCSTNPCRNGGTCTNTDDGKDFTCDCPSQLTGPNCNACVEENMIVINGLCTTNFIQTCQEVPNSVTEDVNDCVYQGVVRQWSALTGIDLLGISNAETRAVYLDTVEQWEELARTNGLAVGQAANTAGSGTEEDIWRADMEAWLSNFKIWAAYIQNLTGEAPCVPDINLAIEDTQAIYDTLNAFWSRAVQEFDPAPLGGTCMDVA